MALGIAPILAQCKPAEKQAIGNKRPQPQFHSFEFHSDIANFSVTSKQLKDQ
jgi:hypothetical protein